MRRSWTCVLKQILFLVCIAWSPQGWGAEDVNDAIRLFNAHATYPIPTLSEAQVQRLLEGKLVRIREGSKDKSQPQRGIGLKIIQQPRNQLWVGAVDDHMSSKAAASELELPRAGPGSRWYQRLWLPWPFAQRHWVIDVNDTHTLARETSGRAWEHYWSLTPNGESLATALIASGAVDGVSSKDAEGFVYTPVNKGAYFGIVLENNRTLWGFHATTVVGGNISDRLIADFTMMQLKGLFKTTSSVVKRPAHITQVATHPLWVAMVR